MNLLWLPGTERTVIADGENVRPATLFEAAIEYAQNGWRVFPCAGKEPLIAGGFKSASCDPNQVAAWWRAHPKAGIGWAIPEGWWALDVDRKSFGLESRTALEKQHGPLPFTLRQITGSGGEHWIFRVPAGLSVRQGAGLLPGLDTRLGGRGYLMVAPSIHPIAGKPYRWHTAIDPLEPPAWLAKLVKAPEKPAPKPYTPPPASWIKQSGRESKARAALHGMAKKMAAAGEGTRNDLLNWCWFKMAEYQDVVPPSESASVLRAAAIAAGLGESEADKVLRL